MSTIGDASRLIEFRLALVGAENIGRHRTQRWGESPALSTPRRTCGGELAGPGLFGMVGAAAGSMVVGACGLINALSPSVNNRGSSLMPSVAVNLRNPLSMTSAILGVRRSVGQTTRL